MQAWTHKQVLLDLEAPVFADQQKNYIYQFYLYTGCFLEDFTKRYDW